jgi:asparagine synthase (glutamine-hydrolysing)
MCGIAGFQGAFTAAQLRAMTDCLAHRGPDGQGTVLFDARADLPPAGLGHRRLAIIDLSADGAQPMTVACEACGSHTHEDLSLVFNGEIYNFRELRDELAAAGHRFTSHSDTEVLLHLYAAEGLDFLPRLNGIFALALRDGRERGRPHGVERGDVLVARDPLGVKPFYYTESDAGVVFASELKALLRTGAITPEIDLVALHHYLAYLWVPAPRTMLAGVRKLEPASALLLRGGAVARRWEYYQLPHPQEHFTTSFDRVAAELHDVVERAVQRQMVSDVPVGAFLSGGLDSSSIVALMMKGEKHDTPDCYSIGFEGDATLDGTPNDLPYARRVAAHLGVPLHEIVVTPSIIDQLERMILAVEEPQADPAPINAMLIAERARADGYKVLMSGAGGDDLFSGYRRHRAVGLERYWSWLPLAARRGLGASARALANGGGVGGMHRAGLRRAVKAFSYADYEPDPRLVSYFWWSGEALRRSLYGAELGAALHDVDTAEPLLATLRRIPRETSRLNRMLELECRHFLADHNLSYTDKVGMAHGVEIRVPLLDLELVEFASRIPPAYKQRGATGKAILKRAMEPELPREVIYRAKTGFGVPLRRWLDVELRDTVDDLLSEGAVARRGLFDPDAVRGLVDRDRAGRVDGSYTIFALLCLELWCRGFIDRAWH